MPIILGANTASTGAYEVANSCRFNDGSNQFFEKVMGTPTSTKIGTFSCWVKLGNITTEQTMLGAYVDSANRHHIEFQADHNIEIFGKASGSTNMSLITNAYYRDVSAWQNIVVAYDTSQGTASNRVKLYVNGTQVTSFATETYPSQDTVLQFNTDGSTHTVGRNKGGNYADGYMCEVVFIDGQQLTPTSFGEFDSDTNIWKPIDVSSLTGGNVGFYLDFEDGSNLGNDVFGGTDFDETNITSANQSTDTCTNNFATMNPLASQSGSNASSSVATFSDGNLVVDAISSETVIANIGVDTGKWFWEVKVLTDQDGLTIGGVNEHHHLDAELAYNSPSSPSNAKAFGYYGGNGNKVTTIGDGSQFSSYGDAIAVNDIIGVALNLDDDEVVFYKNGTAQNSGTAISLTALGSGELYFPAVGNYSASNIKVSFNFGNPTFSISSGNSDGNGYGNFEYSVPSGYYALNTKNLAEYG